MSKRHPQNGTPVRSAFRCAVYSRKSTEEGLHQEFNSLDAQRESGEAYIKSQAQEGWTCLPDRYDDGGFSGANMDRPALKRLLADIEAGRIDAVVVYKIDRLSRSLLDFAKMMAVFEQHHVSFVSVTQQFNTANSMGRLVLNMLFSFAQFERELVSERTRDKIAATRRKGMWCGGHPILGYDIDPTRFKLIVNQDEAVRVRAIFELYLEHQALLPVVQELARRGWVNKSWTTRKGRERGGNAFVKTSLHQLLTNVAYAGKVKYKTEVHAGEHQAIVDAEAWQRVQSVLQRNGRTGGGEVRNKFGALLKGILRCAPCDSAMIPAHTTRKGNKRYRYYTCCAAQKRGWHTCPSKSLPAGEVERFVLDQIRCIGQDPALRRATLDAARSQTTERLGELETERRGLEREVAGHMAEIRKLLAQADLTNIATTARLAHLQERLRLAEERSTTIRQEMDQLTAGLVDEHEVALALSAFDPVWQALTPREQVRLVQLLVERVDYDGAKSTVAITFHPTGIKTLAQEMAQRPTEKSA